MAIAFAFLMIVPISVRLTAHMPTKMIGRAMDEAAAIWRDAGVDVEWETGDPVPESLRVEFGDAYRRTDRPDLPIAWIGFLNDEPDDTIYVSRANAMLLLAASVRLDDMPTAAVNEYVGRALGRAPAHEIGHYLFRSPAHDRDGVMATHRTAGELFGQERRRFAVSAAERDRLLPLLERDRVANRAASPLD